jgi:hypothetical protein
VKIPTGRTLRIGAASAALLCVSAVTLTSLASSALFTDSKTTGASTLASGSVALGLGGSATTNALAAGTMAPGDTKYAVVTVTNSGSLALRYSGTATWSASNALSQAITLSVQSIASAGATCDATVGTNWAAPNVAANITASGTSVALFGSPVAGQQTGDRTLSAASAEYFCIREQLPSTATNTVANLTSNVNLQFDAEQTANNA